MRAQDRNGLDDVLLSFRKDAANTIFRSVFYVRNGFGGKAAEGALSPADVLRRDCAADPRDAACASYLGPATAADL